MAHKGGITVKAAAPGETVEKTEAVLLEMTRQQRPS